MTPGEKSQSARFARLLIAVAQGVSRIERDQICCGELTFQQFETLRRLDQNATSTVGSLATALAIDDSTASRNVALLVRDGYVKKTRDPADARTLLLRLTARGRGVLTDLRCEERDRFAALFERLTAIDREKVVAALALLERALTPAAPECCADDLVVVRRPSSG